MLNRQVLEFFIDRLKHHLGDRPLPLRVRFLGWVANEKDRTVRLLVEVGYETAEPVIGGPKT